MFSLQSSDSPDDSQTHPTDPDAAVAYRSLERVLSVGCEPHSPSDVRALVHAVLRSYIRALEAPRTRRRRIAWAIFVRIATLLYFAFDRHRERHADARWRQAALTLQQIALENADLVIGSALEEAS